MARLIARREREDDDDTSQDVSREATPLSTAPEDRKRLRRSNVVDEDEVIDSPSLDKNDRSIQVHSRKWPGHSMAAMLPRGTGTQPKHQPGAILRVKLTNFVTYTSAEFFPGPNLNMVIGPNGTGKSTLVCAICLGLGWGPQLLGRAKDPVEFIKHGCQEARIEIELQRASTGPAATKNNPIFTRRIRKDGKSEYQINGKNASNKLVLDLARKFNIQIDNLCQFLPQDRVVEFAQMTPVQMLESTMKAAAQPETLDHFESLKGLREKQQDLMANNRGDREMLEGLEKRQESQRADVDRMRERQVILKQIEWLEKCRPVPKYNQAKVKLRELNATKNNLLQTVRRLQEESGPVLEKLDAKKAYLETVKEYRKKLYRAVEACESEVKRLDKRIVDITGDIKEKDNQITREQADIKTKRDSINRHRTAKTNYIANKQTEPEPFDSRAVNEKIRDLTTRKRALEQKIAEITEQGAKLQADAKIKIDRKKACRDELDSLKTQQGQQETKLKNLSSDTYLAWNWIKENQTKFKKQVFGPPLVELSLTDLSKAEAIESMLRKNNLIFLTVQCREDFILLQQELAKHKYHDVSMRTYSDADQSRFSPPFRREQLQDYGLENWAIEFLSGPQPVLAMLCEATHLHQCALAKHDVTQQQHDAIATSPIRSYVAAGKLNKFIRRAEYGAAGNATQINDLRKAVYWTDQPLNSGQGSHLEREIDVLQSELIDIRDSVARIRNDKKSYMSEHSDVMETIERLTEDRDKKQKAMAEYKALDTKIEDCDRKMTQQQQAMNDIRARCADLAKEKDEQMFAKAETILEFCDATHRLKHHNTKLLESDMILVEAQSDSETLNYMNATLLNDLQTKRQSAEAAQKACEDVRKAAQLISLEIQKISEEAEELQEQGEPGLYEFFHTFVDRGGERCELSIEQLDDELEIEHSKLALTEGGNTNSIQEFEERARKITRLKEKLTTFRDEQSGLIGAIQEVRKHFEAELDPIVAKINAAFSDSFARIGCAGQVAVSKAASEDPADCTEEMGGPQNGLDFENWAIHISVKFRESEPLSLLDSHRQSGGERAVSTIFYLMALQSLSRSPFRVVDEINQGMDPRNERMVHGRMVDIAAADEAVGSQGSQYFLITPKLLSGLKYRRGMTVLCIVSGENMPKAEPDKRFDFAEFARRARSLGFNSPSGRTDSGISFTSTVGGRGQVELTA